MTPPDEVRRPAWDRTPTCVLSPAGTEVRYGHDPDAFVEIGSLSKVLTGTLLARLATQGVLSPDDPLERWLDTTPATGITLHRLATHTSGLPRLPPGIRPFDPYRAFTEQALRGLLPRLDTLRTAEPGAHELYSNFGYAVLGYALATAGGRPYPELLDELVLAPLGLSGLVSHAPPGDRQLLPKGLLGRPRRPWTMTGAILPAGGLWATPRAVARLLTGLLLDRTLGDPAPSWQRTRALTWHNGATGTASVFAGAFPDGRWIVVHRLGGRHQVTDRMAIERLRAMARS
ncbi:serine hydrolase domain-containing protein [Streptomyces orinoci]|uniref:Serine hydrolase n=1 Tax=Streptomyces orinoci TaxID=67339 RepID=A0ABV3JQS1_STRON|nr:serine hydrolase [Streptomyces orinoci]